MDGQCHAPAALTSEKTRYPLNTRLGEPQGQSRWVQKILLLTSFDTQILQQHRGSLYRLRYPSLQGQNVICFKAQFIPQSKHCVGYKNHVMLYTAKATVCSEIHTKHMNTLYRQNTELLNVKPDSSQRNC
jgi:hypothetical protein